MTHGNDEISISSLMPRRPTTSIWVVPNWNGTEIFSMFFQGAGLKLRKLVIKNATYKGNKITVCKQKNDVRNEPVQLSYFKHDEQWSYFVGSCRTAAAE